MMKTDLIVTYIFLILLTFFSGFVATSFSTIEPKVVLLMFSSVCKFWLIAFQFMELKKANIFWKRALIILLFLIIGIIICIKNL